MSEGTVLLSGCGNIGFRHLQALCAMSVGADITVVEPNEGAHDRIRDQFAAAAATGHRFTLATTLPPAQRFDLVVVATTATDRRAVVGEILEHHDVSAMILEKVLFQTIGDLDAVGAALDAHDVDAYVNCGRRAFAGYHAVRDRLSGGGPVEVVVRGQRLGLASNVVHFLDLAEFLNDASLVEVDVSGLDPGSVPGKRDGSIEIFGAISATLDNGGRLSVESRDVEPVAIEVTASNDAGVARIDEVARLVIDDGAQAAPFASRNVSETPDVYQDALESGRCVLTPYHDSARQHRMLLTALRPHLGLSNADDVPCPIS